MDLTSYASVTRQQVIEASKAMQNYLQSERDILKNNIVEEALVLFNKPKKWLLLFPRRSKTNWTLQEVKAELEANANYGFDSNFGQDAYTTYFWARIKYERQFNRCVQLEKLANCAQSDGSGPWFLLSVEDRADLGM